MRMMEASRRSESIAERNRYRFDGVPCPIDDYSDLRPARQTRNITLTAVANHFGVWPTHISRLERGLTRDDTLATNYRNWLSIQLIDAA